MNLSHSRHRGGASITMCAGQGACWARVGVRGNVCVAYPSNGRVLFGPFLVECVLRRVDADIDRLSGHRRADCARAYRALALALDHIAGPGGDFQLFTPDWLRDPAAARFSA